MTFYVQYYLSLSSFLSLNRAQSGIGFSFSLAIGRCGVHVHVHVHEHGHDHMCQTTPHDIYFRD